MLEKPDSSTYKVIDLGLVRGRLELPMQVMAYLVQRIGTTVHIRHPGFLEVSFSDGTRVEVRVRHLDLAQMEEETRRLAAAPPPEMLTLDLKQYRE